MEPYVDLTGAISLNNGEIWDDPEYVVGLPFDFQLNETTTDIFQFYGLGALFAAPTNDEDIFAYVIPFECDLLDRGEVNGAESLSPISFKVDGVPGSRIFKLEYKNAGSYAEYDALKSMDMFINFQMWLYEGSNKIQFRYGPASIDDPALFYEGQPGAIIGATDYDEFNDELTNVHLITGEPTSPYLTTEPLTMFGTPPEGTVYTLSMGEPLAIDVVVQHDFSYCNGNGSIDTEVNGGLPPYLYEWSNGETTPDIQNLAEGIYGLTVTDGTNSELSIETVIFSPADLEPMTLEINSTDETSDGANDGTASAEPSEGLQPYTYLWNNGATTQSIENLTPGVYTITVIDDAGCDEISEAVINPFGCVDLLIEAAVTDVSCFGVCDGSISIIQIINGVAPFTYEWSHGDGDETAEALCAGDYSVTVTDADNCIVNGDWIVSEPDLLVADATSTNETFSGANDGTATVEASGGSTQYEYLWSNGELTPSISGLAPGTYSVIVTDDNNCEAFDTVIVEAGPCALLTGTVTDVTCNGLCDGGIDLNGVWMSIIWNTGSSSESLQDLCAGDYFVTVTDITGCTAEATFSVVEPDELIATTGSTEETELGQDGTAWVVPTGGTQPYSYEWSNGSTDSLITGLEADIYSVTLTDSNGCSDTAEVEVTEFACFIISENEVQHVFCHDSCDGLIFVVPLGGVGPFEYDWSIGDTSNVVFDLCAGWYSVTVTDLGQDGCSSFIDVQILQPDTFYFTIDEVAHLTDTSVASIDVTFNGGTLPYHPQWLGPDGFISFDEDIDGLSPGTYVLHLFDSNDCSVSDTVEILDLTTGLPALHEDAFSIYPNPSTTEIYIDTKFAGDYTAELYSVLGVKSGSWKNARMIDVDDLPAGMYVVRIDAADGYFVKRIVVEKN